ncbi:hypothetical protein GW750_01825 [bacterium]|nr:hypothetical protein [bacterium]
MYPIAYQYKTEGSRLLFQCDTCGKQHRNKQAIDDEIQNIDSYIQKYKKIIDG